MKSVGMAKYMQTKVPGMDVPEEIVKRLRCVEKEEAKRRGNQDCGGADSGI